MKKNVVLLLTLFCLSLAGSVSAELSPGQAAPDFSLPDVDGKNHSLSEYDGKFRILEWTNHGCPFVQKHYDSGNMQQLQKSATEKGAVWLTINSSAPGLQGNMSGDEWKKLIAEKKAASTATLLDPEGMVGKLYGAQTTPHMYIIDPQGKLVYQGAIDSISSAEAADVPKAQNYVASALDEAMAGKPVSNPSTKAYGCSVKYKK